MRPENLVTSLAVVERSSVSDPLIEDELYRSSVR